jgi:hypothetical protein
MPVRSMPSLSFPVKYREYALLFAGGLLAGLLLFLIWLSLQPARKVEAPADAATAAGAVRGPVRQPDGVLGDIAGDFEPGARSVVDSPTQDEADADAPVDDGAAEPADATEAPLTDEQAIAGALLSPEGGEGRPVLQTWYVEVARGPGVSEILEIAAPSSEQALVVLRDFRGNPRVLRGPSPQPFP